MNEMHDRKNLKMLKGNIFLCCWKVKTPTSYSCQTYWFKVEPATERSVMASLRRAGMLHCTSILSFYPWYRATCKSVADIQAVCCKFFLQRGCPVSMPSSAFWLWGHPFILLPNTVSLTKPVNIYTHTATCAHTYTRKDTHSPVQTFAHR